MFPLTSENVCVMGLSLLVTANTIELIVSGAETLSPPLDSSPSVNSKTAPSEQLGAVAPFAPTNRAPAYWRFATLPRISKTNSVGTVVAPTVKVLVTVCVVVAVTVVEKLIGALLMLMLIPPTLMMVLFSKNWFITKG